MRLQIVFTKSDLNVKVLGKSRRGFPNVSTVSLLLCNYLRQTMEHQNNRQTTADESIKFYEPTHCEIIQLCVATLNDHES